jgi:hypothetical protein
MLGTFAAFFLPKHVRAEEKVQS